LIGQNTTFFNRMYRIGGAVAPAFWGRQVEQRIPDLIRRSISGSWIKSMCARVFTRLAF